VGYPRAYCVTYTTGRAWVRRGTGTWYPATTDPAGPTETRADLERVLPFFEGIPGDPYQALLGERVQR
jgi:hypothetical protein